MHEFSFDIKTSKDFFNKLLQDYKDFALDNISSRLALNCAMTAWHLTEWVYREFNLILSKMFPKIADYQQDIKQQCPSLQIMQDLTNGTKHYSITRYVPTVKDTNLHEGPFCKEFSREFDTSTLEINLNDGTKIYFEDEIEKVVNFWKQYFKTTLQISVDAI